MTDKFAGMSATLGSPFEDGAAVTPSDSADIDVTSAMWVGGAGDLKVTYKSGRTDTLQAVPAGMYMPIRVTRVWATGTTATKISALY